MARINKEMENLIKFTVQFREVLKTLYSYLLPEVCGADQIFVGEEEFRERIEASFREHNSTKDPQHERQRVVVSAICSEVFQLAKILRGVCVSISFEKFAKKYLDPKLFVNFVLEQNHEKLRKLVDITRNCDDDLGRLFTEISGVFDGVEGRYESFSEGAKRKAAEDVGKVKKGVAKRLKEVPEEVAAESEEESGERGIIAFIKEKFEAMMAFLSSVVNFRKRGVKRIYDAKQREFCQVTWNLGKKDFYLKNMARTRVKYEMVFNKYKEMFKQVGVESENAFRKITHSMHSLKHQRRKAALEAKMMVK